MEDARPPQLSFQELLPPMTPHEATVEANRCLYCYDAPCLHACPTHIDIPTFIRKIATGNVSGAAHTILESNFLGGTCARVCPVQELCEGACVYSAHDKPIQIGRLQRFATDHLHARGEAPFTPAPPTGRRVAVVGSGPAGLSASAELAKQGHVVTLYEKRELGGGLSTYGIIVLREPVEVALREVDAVRDLGVQVVTGQELNSMAGLDELLAANDAVVLSLGLGAVPALGIPGEAHILSGLDVIEASKLERPTGVGARAVVIGAGNTAIDAATIARRAGADTLMVYRRTEREMTAYHHEYLFALSEGIGFSFLTQPIEVLHENGQVTGLRCVRMGLGAPDASSRARPEPIPGSDFVISCDTVISAIGQEKPALAVTLGLDLDHGYIRVDDELRTSLPRVYAGGDCIRARGNASTVMAVQDGKLIAASLARILGTQAAPIAPTRPPEVRDHPLYQAAHGAVPHAEAQHG